MSWTRGGFPIRGMSGGPTTISSQSSQTASLAGPSSSQVMQPLFQCVSAQHLMEALCKELQTFWSGCLMSKTR